MSIRHLLGLRTRPRRCVGMARLILLIQRRPIYAIVGCLTLWLGWSSVLDRWKMDGFLLQFNARRPKWRAAGRCRSSESAPSARTSSSNGRD